MPQLPPIMKKIQTLFIALSFAMTSAYTQDITGDWYALLKGPDLHLILHVSHHGNTLQANFDSPDQNAFGIPVDTAYLDGDQFTYAWKQGDLNYTGTFNAKRQTIHGFLDQLGHHSALNYSRSMEEVNWRDPDFIRTKYDKQEVYITMRDGIRLFTSVYTPKDKTRTYPVLMTRTPYGIESSAKDYSRLLPEYSHFLEDGYIIVLQDVRGRFMSEGTFEDVRPFIQNKTKKQTDENSDTWDTVDWLIHHIQNNNGKVGMIGVSYPGFYCTMGLPDAHPALKAVSPQAPVTNWFLGDDWHHHGAFFEMDAFSFYSVFGIPRHGLTRQWPKANEIKSDDNYEFYLELGPLQNIENRYFDDTISFWSDVMDHPDYDDFWKARNPLRYLGNIKPAVLEVGGWFDAEDLFGTLNTYKTIEMENPENQNRLIMGPWSHHQWSHEAVDHLGNISWGGNTTDYFNTLELKFFNYYLKGEGKMDLPEASVFISGKDEWRSFDSWPPAETDDASLYLRPNGKLTFASPGEQNSFDEYVSDPARPVPYIQGVHFKRTADYMTADQRFASRRPDVMVYQTDPLDEDITLTGPLQVDLYVSTTGTDADYVVKLIDVYPPQTDAVSAENTGVPMGGYQMLVRGDIMRGRFRNSYEKPEAFVPGEITHVPFEMQDVAHCFKKGHRIMVQVQSSWFPLVNLNPQQFVDIYHCSQSAFIKATQRIYHDAQRPSGIRVKVLKDR